MPTPAKVADPSEALNADLEKGLVGLNKHIRSYEHIMLFL